MHLNCEYYENYNDQINKCIHCFQPPHTGPLLYIVYPKERSGLSLVEDYFEQTMSLAKINCILKPGTVRLNLPSLEGKGLMIVNKMNATEGMYIVYSYSVHLLMHTICMYYVHAHCM